MSNCASVAERRVPTPLDVVVIGAGFAGPGAFPAWIETL